MPENSSSQTVTDQGITWFARLNSGDATAEEYQSFSRWRAEHPSHAAAYDEVVALWSELDGLQDPRPDEQQIPAPSDFPVLRNHQYLSRLRPWGLLAMSLMFVVVSGLLGTTDVLTTWRSDFHAGKGESMRYTLEDGSTLTLDSESAVSVDFSPERRHLVLHKGRAYFEVAPNTRRPFVVSSGEVEAEALGTAYEVRRNDDAVSITVFESHVLASVGEDSRVLKPGEGLRYSPGRVAWQSEVDLQKAAAWQRGKLVFSNQPLADVVDELNRYRTGKIIIMDTALKAFSVSGVFNLHEPEAALVALTEVLPIRQRRLTSYLVLLDRVPAPIKH